MGPVNEPIFDRNENNFIREGWGGKRWEEKGRRGMGREGGGGKREGKGWGEKGGRKREGEGLGEKGGGKIQFQSKINKKQNKIKATTHKHMG